MKQALQWVWHWFARQAGETQPTQVPWRDRAPAFLLPWVEQASQFIVQRLLISAEPTVWYTCDTEGRLWWHAYDPVTGRSLKDVSEAEMRAWIEQRYASTLAS